MKPRLVLGVGNILMMDDGVGVRVAEALQDAPLPADVEVADGGTFGSELIDLLADRDHLIVVDAVAADAAPGTVLRFDDDECLAQAPAAMSLHEVGVLETLRMAHLMGCAPKRVTLFGIVPDTVGPGLELTARMAGTVPKVVEVVRRALAGER